MTSRELNIKYRKYQNNLHVFLMYVHVDANVYTCEHRNGLFSSRARLKRCRQTCLYVNFQQRPASSSQPSPRRLARSLQTSEQQPRANLVAPIPARQRPALKSMQGWEEGQIMKTSEGTRVRGRELDRFRPVSQRTDGQTHLLEPEAPARVATRWRFGLCGIIMTDWIISRVWALYRHGNLSTSWSFRINIQSVNCVCVLSKAAFQIWTLSATPACFIFPRSFFFFFSPINSPCVLRWAARLQMFVFQRHFFSFFLNLWQHESWFSQPCWNIQLKNKQ